MNDVATEETPTTELSDDQWPEDDWTEDDWSESDSTDRLSDPVPIPALDQPAERFKKRRVVIGVAFLVLGLAGAIADLFDTSGGAALAVAGLLGSVALLITLVLGARRNARLFSHTSI